MVRGELIQICQRFQHRWNVGAISQIIEVEIAGKIGEACDLGGRTDVDVEMVLVFAGSVVVQRGAGTAMARTRFCPRPIRSRP